MKQKTEKKTAKKYGCTLFIFRRDLRLIDNTALIAACRSSRTVIPIFIFDPRQVGENPYRSNHAVQFMVESLEELDRDLEKQGGRLCCYYGEPSTILRDLFRKEKIEALYFNRDYTPFSHKRDGILEELATESGVSVHCYDDALINPPGGVLKSDGKPYTVFTPFFRRASQEEVKPPQRFRFSNCFEKSAHGAKKISEIELGISQNQDLAVRGGRENGLKLLKRATTLTEYQNDRDFPARPGTSRLSAHHKFGTVSVREVYAKIAQALGFDYPFIRELYWRDFFTHIGFHFPHVFRGSFYRQYNDIRWSQSRKKFNSWCNGETGFPIVDAGMRELNATGYMHNRVRMVVASFLTKDLHLNWQWGEKYFAQKLVDYDPAVNNGNWQWAASTGCDAQPYFRIFNPWRQQERFDSECEYIKKWVPELTDFPAKEIHRIWKTGPLLGYVAPIVDHREAAARAEELYIEARERK